LTDVILPSNFSEGMAGGCCVQVTGGRGEGDDQPRGGESLATASQEAHHVACELFRGRRGREPRSGGARPINQKFREIPLYAVAQEPALLLLEPDIEWVGVVAVDLDRRTATLPHGARRMQDLRIRPRLLMAELIAWEARTSKPRGPNCSRRFYRPLYCGAEPHFQGIDDQAPYAVVGGISLSPVLSRALKS
jgi:hypothetical protein